MWTTETDSRAAEDPDLGPARVPRPPHRRWHPPLETKAFTWIEYRDLLIAAHRQLPGGNIVLIWDREISPYTVT